MSEPTINDFENSLRILARIIAQAYLKDLALKKAGKKVVKEENDANGSGLRGLQQRATNTGTVDCPSTLKRLGQNKGIREEENNANQRSKRSCETAPTGENQAGNQERKH
ncbi:hypothetical protein [Dehalococcoides mccartyi]|uniref:hypothetical protein n=1 Tax=Dehalococcoides mccartyi TaxID=61435 RepID=UPI00398B368F